MDTTVINTRHGPATPVLTTDSTTAATSIAVPADTLVDPIGLVNGTPAESPANGYIRVGRGGGQAPNWIKLLPYGTGADGATMLMSVFAVERILNKAAPQLPVWIHHLIGAWTCTLSTKTGIARSAITASHRYADTLALTANSATEGVSVFTSSPQDNSPGFCLADITGAELVLVLFALNNSATASNALHRLI